jgi:hypothetical protein
MELGEKADCYRSTNRRTGPQIVAAAGLPEGGGQRQVYKLSHAETNQKRANNIK